MGILADLLNFISDKKKIHQIIFILPLVIFYLTNKANWLLLLAVIVLASMEVYRIDLENKVPLFIAGRLKQKNKNKSLLRNWRDQIKDACKEFDYLYSWPLLGIISIIFITEFIYSACLSYNYNKILFGLHIFLVVYIFFLQAIINKNLDYLSKNKMPKKKK